MKATDYVIKSHVYGKNPHDVFIVRFGMESATPSSVELCENITLSALREALGDKFVPQKEIKPLVSELEEKGNICFFSKDILAFVKENVIKEIAAYDASTKVNSFTYNGIELWLDQQTRAGLIIRFNAEEAMGKTETTLWAGTMPLTLSITDGRKMLYALEYYASVCFDVTASHKASVDHMTTIDDVINYDFTKEYPNKLAL